MLDFEILIDDLLPEVLTEKLDGPLSQNKILSLINDFEEGEWRYRKFLNFIWDNIKESALSAAEREKLAGKESTALEAAAKNLRLTDSADDFGTGSELAEILLYGILKHHHGALSVVPKIFYKQNTQDNAKGADSVHIVLDDVEGFTLWLGEAKFYTSIEDVRLGKIIESVKNSLDPDKLKKENRIITNVSDLDQIGISLELSKNIKDFLNQSNSLDSIKPRLHIPILLLHQCDITAGTKIISPEYRDKIKLYHKNRATSYFKKQIEELNEIHLYHSLRFHLILFPVPNKKEIVERFVSRAESLRS